MTGYMLRVVWPILDPTLPAQQLATEVCDDLPGIAASQGARVTGAVRFRVADAATTPGHPRASRHVLIAEAPARRLTPRPYRAQP